MTPMKTEKVWSLIKDVADNAPKLKAMLDDPKNAARLASAGLDEALRTELLVTMRDHHLSKDHVKVWLEKAAARR